MQMELFEDFQPLKTNEWKWTMANDYPTQKNGLKVFSYLLVVVVQLWDINLRVVRF